MSKVRAGYTKRKNGMLQKQFTIDKQRYTVYGWTYKECDAKEEEKRKQLQKDQVNYNSITLDEYFKIWESRRDGTVKASTKYSKRVDYYSFLHKEIGSRQVHTLTKNDIYALRSRMLNRGLNTSTINRVITSLKAMFRQMVEDELITKNPCDGMAVLKRTEPEARETYHRALNDDEIAIFLKYADNLFYQNMCKFMLMTGVRCGEACALLWDDIDYDKECIYISKTVSMSDDGLVVQTPKTAKGKRVIPMNKSIRVLLYEQYELQDCVRFNTKNVFPNSNGNLAFVGGLNSYIKRTLDRCSKHGHKIEDFSSHAFRDTFATKAIENGMQPETLQRILGHANINITMNLYYHLSDEKKYNEMQLIDKAFFDV